MKIGCDHSHTFWTIHSIFPMTLGWQTIINTFSLIKSILLHSTHSVLNRNKITFAKAICQKAKVFHVLFKLWKFTFLKLSNTLCIAYIYIIIIHNLVRRINPVQKWLNVVCDGTKQTENEFEFREQHQITLDEFN